MTKFDLILRGGTAVLPGLTASADLGIREGKIAAIGDLGKATAPEIVDCTGLHVLPGVIDTQVHFREPGAEHKEDLATGTAAAAMGGVTAIFEMPNTTPLTTTPETLADKMRKADGRAMVDYAFYFGGTAENAAQLPEWENLPGACGVKIFMGSSTGALLSSKDEEIEAVLRHGRRVVAVHAEDEAIMNENKKTLLGGVETHPVWRSAESSRSAVARLVRLARTARRRVHVLHITAREELEILAENRDLATCEVLPNHLTLSAPECYERLGTLAQQNPPIRDQAQQDALWRAVQNGLIDIIGSDHAPHTLEEKAKPYPESPSGTPGVQTLVPVMLDHVNAGRLTLERFVDLTACGPQRVLGIAGKGRIARGYDADFTIVDLKARRTITNEQQKSRCGWTPYDNMQVTGWPVMTVIRGQIVMRDDALLGQPLGAPVRFGETLT